MIENITIFNFSGGTGPYDIYACDITNTFCFLVSGNTTFPITFNVPTELYGVNKFIVKVIDQYGCQRFKVCDCQGIGDTCLIMTEDLFDLFTEDGFGLQMEYCPPDPTPTPTPVPTNCNCIGITNSDIVMGYFDYTTCDGIFESTIPVSPGTTYYVCGSNPTNLIGVTSIVGEPCVNNSCV